MIACFNAVIHNGAEYVFYDLTTSVLWRNIFF